MAISIEELKHKLIKVRRSGNGYTAKCPAHDDENPSLSLREGRNGNVLIHCFAGCTPGQVVSAMGYEMSDLFPDTRFAGLKLQDEYSYVDEQGLLLYQVLRYRDDAGKKKFRQRQPGFGGEWEWSRQGARLVPYRLPEVLGAAENDEPIIITEGEKDVHTFERYGYTATTFAGGAKGWKSEYGQYFLDCDVHICGDNDEPGQSYTESIARDISPFARVSIVDLPALYKDITDWHSAKGSEDELKHIIDTARPYRTDLASAKVSSTYDHDSLSYTYSDVMTAVPMWSFDDPPPMNWMIDEIMPENYITILGADGGTGKSYLALRVLYSIATGQPFFDIPCASAGCLYVDYELQEADQKRRWLQVLRGLGTDQYDSRLTDRVFFYKPEGPLSEPTTIKALKALVSKHDVGFIVIDSLTIAMGVDSKEQRDVTTTLKELERISTILAIDHVSMSTARGNLSSATVYGSVFKRNISRSLWMLAKVSGGGLVLRQNKTNFGPAQDLVCFETVFDDDGATVKFEPRELTDTVMGGALEALSTHEITYLGMCELYAEKRNPITPGEISTWRSENDEGVSERTVRNHLTLLRSDGKAQNVGSNSWMPVKDDSSLSRSLGTGNSDDREISGAHRYKQGQRVVCPKGPGTIEEAELSVNGRLPVRLLNGKEVMYFHPSTLESPGRKE